MNWTPLSKEKHSDFYIKSIDSLDFLQDQVLAPIYDFELANCSPWLPIVFAKENSQIKPFALMGLEPGKNLVINPRGKWPINFFPSIFAAFPFRLAKGEGDQNIVAFFDDGSLITKDNNGERLFNEDGTASKVLDHYIQLLKRIDQGNRRVVEACSNLAEMDFLEPITIKGGVDSKKDISLQGILRINPQKFKDIGDKKFMQLRQSNALDFCYAHFFSMGGIMKLQQFKMLKKENGRGLEELGSKIFEESSANLDFDVN